jgi:hypothetical protein|tara:strand:+ start:774 stop:950 length:177 start_codon:yes stop_codon:yes gene_type:complete
MLNENNLKITIVDLSTIRIDVDSIRFIDNPVYIEDNSDNSDGSIHDLVAPLLDWWYKS